MGAVSVLGEVKILGTFSVLVLVLVLGVVQSSPDAATVRQEAKEGVGHTNSLTVTLLIIPRLGGLLHQDVDLIGVLADSLKLDVFGVHKLLGECWGA